MVLAVKFMPPGVYTRAHAPASWAFAGVLCISSECLLPISRSSDKLVSTCQWARPQGKCLDCMRHFLTNYCHPLCHHVHEGCVTADMGTEARSWQGLGSFVPFLRMQRPLIYVRGGRFFYNTSQEQWLHLRGPMCDKQEEPGPQELGLEKHLSCHRETPGSEGTLCLTHCHVTFIIEQRREDDAQIRGKNAGFYQVATLSSFSCYWSTELNMWYQNAKQKFAILNV